MTRSRTPRQLVLFEFEAPTDAGGNTAGTLAEDLINNTKWSGRRDGGTNAPIPARSRISLVRACG
ncbi:MAG TPA: hypothetical protein VFQ44_20470 [Streptosporangiaceae bacterium]|nr:hypothetical protein [Streptosporangiaceae bacterium]